MPEDVRLTQADIKKTAVTIPVTMENLWRLVTWGSVATTALLVAVIASRGVVNSQRATVAVSTLSTGAGVSTPTSALPKVGERPDQTERLSAAIDKLIADNGEIKKRLSSVEQNVADVTGSIQKQIDAVKETPAAVPWPDGASIPVTPVPVTPVPVTPVPATSALAPASMDPVADTPLSPSTPAQPSPIQPVQSQTGQYGIDLGGGTSIAALRARWAGIRSAHRQLFRGLSPTVTVREKSHLNIAELRLVVGPLASPEAVKVICAALLADHVTCEQTAFGSQHLAVE